MEKCTACKFRSIADRVVRDKDTGKVTEVASVCNKCGHVVRKKDYKNKPRRFKFGFRK
jgi:uncharacterized Zn finger protein